MENKIPVDELLKNMNAYQQGMEMGRDMAIKKYDALFIEIWDKIDDVEKKVDKNFVLLFNTLKIFEDKIIKLQEKGGLNSSQP